MEPREAMQRAIALAVESVAEGGGPFGAVVVRDGELVATGKNRVVLHGDPTAHAEVEALRAAARALGTHRLAGCELYASCEPCPMCLGAIYWARIERLRYAASRDDAAAAGFDDSLLHAELALPPGRRVLDAGRLEPEEGLRPFAAWREKADRVGY